jgi:hypothetical protein
MRVLVPQLPTYMAGKMGPNGRAGYCCVKKYIPFKCYRIKRRKGNNKVIPSILHELERIYRIVGEGAPTVYDTTSLN